MRLNIKRWKKWYLEQNQIYRLHLKSELQELEITVTGLNTLCLKTQRRI